MLTISLTIYLIVGLVVIYRNRIELKQSLKYKKYSVAVRHINLVATLIGYILLSGIVGFLCMLIVLYQFILDSIRAKSTN